MAMSEARARALVEGGRKRVQFGVNNESFGEFIMSDQVRKPTAEVAHDIMGVAAADTPVGPGTDGHMKDAYRLEVEAGSIKVHGEFRVKVKVHNDDPESALVEFGSKHNQRRRMLGKAGAAFGDFKSKKGKL
jgi:hypothetical protein